MQAEALSLSLVPMFSLSQIPDKLGRMLLPVEVMKVIQDMVCPWLACNVSVLWAVLPGSGGSVLLEDCVHRVQSLCFHLHRQ